MDNWQKLHWRLEAIANNKQGGGCKGVAIIELGLYYNSGQLIGWTRPERTPLEPVQFDTSVFDLQPLRGWNEVILALKRERGVMVRKMLVVRDGEPVGWFREVAGETVRLPVKVAV
jgi:hypothetical protein